MNISKSINTKLFSSFILVITFGLLSLYHVRRRTHDISNISTLKGHAKSNLGKVGVNLIFFKQLLKILPICIPGLFSREARLLLGLGITLIIRTILDIWFATFNGTVVRSIVTVNHDLFIQNAFFKFGLMMWPMSAVNNFLKYTINTLALSFRSRLIYSVHRIYLHEIVFYRVANIDKRLQNIDQLITQDVEKFCETLAHLFSDIAKPLIDIGLFSYKLGENIGNEAPFFMLLYFFISGIFLRYLSPPFGRYVAQEQALEGQFRYNHSRIIAHSEEIAFYNGAERERKYANSNFQKITQHLHKVFLLKASNGVIDSVLVKYCATQLAFYILSRPVFGKKRLTVQIDNKANNSYSTKIMEDYSRNSGFLINLSQAVGRIVLAFRDLTKFAGYTHRVSLLNGVLEDLNSISDKEGGVTIIETEDFVMFEEVPIITPSGDVLIPKMSFKIKTGMNCIVTGPNGCGKSSMFRILGGIWPVNGGRIHKPPKGEVFYVPQKPYLPLGTLRDQIIYPDENRDFIDEEVRRLLNIVKLAYLEEREGGLDAVRDWSEVFSGGEKQRIAMARLFYHKPKFAILDECTSAVSIDVEGIMYRHAKHLGITLLTVSHRPSLFQFHDYILKFDGKGGYTFGSLEERERDGSYISNEPISVETESTEDLKISLYFSNDNTPTKSILSTTNEFLDSRELQYAPSSLGYSQSFDNNIFYKV